MPIEERIGSKLHQRKRWRKLLKITKKISFQPLFYQEDWHKVNPIVARLVKNYYRLLSFY